jgi:hypothetical protein
VLEKRKQAISRFNAITIEKDGRPSKKHLTDPKKGLDIELRKAQKEPIKVSLTLVKKEPIHK